ncbi:MAG: hypothetical protein V4642_14115 [Bacteroidota bacterium]
MLPHIQEEYARKIFSGEKFEAFKTAMDEACGMHIPYRVTEMPVFVSAAFKKKLEDAAVAIITQCTEGEIFKASAVTLEPRYTVPRESPHPTFAVVDFAVTQDAAGEFQPKLIELQGFPSLYGYQYVFATEIKKAFGLADDWDFTFSGLTEAEYVALLKEALLKDFSPDECALLEYKPLEQKTRPDFLALKALTGLEETDILKVKKDGKTLLHERNGKWVPLRRIFNRAIIDELDEKNVELPFSWQDELDVEWAGHPNWYFRISKFVLPFLKHESVPKTMFLHQLDEIPSDLENYVLKPLYSFAGKGVNIAPTESDIAAIPQKDREHWVLQEKVRYAECVYTPEGMNKVEIRVMMIWPDDAEKPLPVMSLVRTGRGPMMNVNYNSLPWSGSSGCLFGE